MSNSDKMVNRFVCHTHSGGTIYDVMVTDRKTGKIILKYDGADPANHEETDELTLKRKGYDVHEYIKESECVCVLPTNTVDHSAEAEWDYGDCCD